MRSARCSVTRGERSRRRALGEETRPSRRRRSRARKCPAARRRSRRATAAARISRSTKASCARLQPVRISKSIKPGGLPVPAGAKGAGYLSPRMKARMAELQLTQADLAGIAGSGTAGRVTVKDLEKFLGGLEEQTAESRARFAPAWPMRCGAVGRGRSRPWACPSASIRSWRIARSAIRSPARRSTPCARSRWRWPRIPTAAARLIGGRAIRSKSIDIGVAVEAQDGIMVPVIRKADKTSLGDLTTVIPNSWSSRASAALTAEDDRRRHRLGFELRHLRPRLGQRRFRCPIRRSCSASAPGRNRRRGARRRSSSSPRPQAELTLSFDHRSLDGGGAGRLLQRIADSWRTRRSSVAHLAVRPCGPCGRALRLIAQ